MKADEYLSIIIINYIFNFNYSKIDSSFLKQLVANLLVPYAKKNRV